MASRRDTLVALLASSTGSLLIACVVLALWVRRSEEARIDVQEALDTPALRDRVVAELSRDLVHVFDSHNDPDVARVLRPYLEGEINTGVPFHSNELGMRERPFALPKPAGTLRVVLLGDSYVMGYGAEEADRMGVFLERYLRERNGGWSGPIECLHLAIGSWNIVSECAYVRRMLADLAPDLVVHLVVSNDLDDVFGVRGFGGLAAFAPRTSERTDSTIQVWSLRYAAEGLSSHLLMGLDHESRTRWADAMAAMTRLERALEAAGARYLVVGHFGGTNRLLWRHMKESFGSEDYVFLPSEWLVDETLVFGRGDSHFRRAGHERLARVLYHAIRERDLLSELALSTWPEAEDDARKVLEQGLAEATDGKDGWVRPEDLQESLQPAGMPLDHWRQVYGGLDRDGHASPFAAFLLPGSGSSTVRVRGRALERPEMSGARVRVSVDEFVAGEIELVPGRPFDALLPIPQAARGRKCVTLRLETDDYVYIGTYRQHCVSFLLDELAIVRE